MNYESLSLVMDSKLMYVSSFLTEATPTFNSGVSCIFYFNVNCVQNCRLICWSFCSLLFLKTYTGVLVIVFIQPFEILKKQEQSEGTAHVCIKRE